MDSKGSAAHEDREIGEVIERLQTRFPEVSPRRIREVVDAEHDRFGGRPIRGFVPVFVERAAIETRQRPQDSP